MKTIFIRLSDYNQWLIDTRQSKAKVNVYREFMKKNANLFKYAYKKEKIDIDFSEAMRRIEAMKDVRVKEKALQLLTTGARWDESTTLDKDGFVIGKGKKRRKLLNSSHVDFKLSYSSFGKILKQETGLKPHSLRKLLATELANNGLSPADIKQIFGWECISTADSYFQSKRDDELASKIDKIIRK